MLRLIGSEAEMQDMLGRTEDAVDARTLAQSQEIVEDVKKDSPGHAAFVRHAVRLGDLKSADQAYTVPKAALADALRALPIGQRDALTRMAGRIRSFAQAQRAAIKDIAVDIPGGRAGHRVEAVRTAGCYAREGGILYPRRCS